MEAEPLLTPAEVSALFHVNVKTVTNWARTGKLTSVRTLGGHRRYRDAEVRALLAGGAEKPADPLAAPVHMLWPRGAPPRGLLSRLRAAGINTLGDLTGCGAGELRGFGLRAPQVDEVRLVLARKGRTLYGEILAEDAA